MVSKEEIHNEFLIWPPRISIIVISSELPEVMKLSDRILVMHEGEISGTFGYGSGFDNYFEGGNRVRAMKLTKTLFERTEFTVLIFIFLIGLFLSLVTNTFLTFNNIMNILLDISGIAIASIGVTMVIITGGIDVSTGAVLGVTAFFVGKLVETGANPGITVVVALVVGALLGSINGALVSYGNIPPIITTLGTMNIYRAATFTLLQGKWINLLQRRKRLHLSG